MLPQDHRLYIFVVEYWGDPSQAPVGRQMSLQSSPGGSAVSVPQSRASLAAQGTTKPQPSNRATQEHASAAGTIAAEFPPALRLYVLFLEAADSHRLNLNLMRWQPTQAAEASLVWSLTSLDQKRNGIY